MSDAPSEPSGKDYVVAAVEDLFFTTRLRAAANEVEGVVLDFASEPGELATRMDRRTPRLVLVDLNAKGFDGVVAVERARSQGGPEVPIVGFFSHVDTELKERALEAGCDEVLPRRAFVQRIPDLLEGSVDVPQSKDI